MKRDLLKRALILVFDGLGIGELPDAKEYNDAGSDTLDNVSKAVGGIHIPCLASFGLGLIEGVDHIEKAKDPVASWGRMREASSGKDTATGHWEMSGVVLKRSFATYTTGFTSEIMEGFRRLTGYDYLGGKAASGTGIIEEFGEEHMKTRKLIVYTSADSVFQIAAHVDVIPLDELYRVCAVAREFLRKYDIGRVIARPFKGAPGKFERTFGRRDYALEPPEATVLEKIKRRGLPVIGIGKIGDIFVHKGLTEEIHTADDMDGIDRTIKALKDSDEGVIFTNLVDFDTLYGHRNDFQGYARALMEMDRRIPEVVSNLGPSDIFIITADHGCDPTTPSTDHSREYVPLLVYGKGLAKGVDLGTRKTFADIGQTLAEIFKTGSIAYGTSFLDEVKK